MTFEDHWKPYADELGNPQNSFDRSLIMVVRAAAEKFYYKGKNDSFDELKSFLATKPYDVVAPKDYDVSGS